MARRPVDTALFGYFMFQIIVTFFFDTQGVYPASWYPTWLQHMRSNYLRDFKDVLIADAWRSPWFLSVCLVEHFIEFPFFIYAARAYYLGAEQAPQVLIPTIMYSVHTMTAILGIWFQVFLADLTPLSSHEVIAPGSLYDRVKLAMVYFPFMVFSIVGLVDSVVLLHKRRPGEPTAHAHRD